VTTTVCTVHYSVRESIRNTTEVRYGVRVLSVALATYAAIPWVFIVRICNRMISYLLAAQRLAYASFADYVVYYSFLFTCYCH